MRMCMYVICAYMIYHLTYHLVVDGLAYQQQTMLSVILHTDDYMYCSSLLSLILWWFIVVGVTDVVLITSLPPLLSAVPSSSSLTIAKGCGTTLWRICADPPNKYNYFAFVIWKIYTNIHIFTCTHKFA